MTTGTDHTPRPAGASPARPRSRIVATRVAWTWIALSSLAIAVYTVVPYLTASLAELSESGVGLAGNYDGRPAVVQAAFYATSSPVDSRSSPGRSSSGADFAIATARCIAGSGARISPPWRSQGSQGS